MPTEPWLKGAIDGIPPMLMPAVHALMQAQEDITRFTNNLTPEEIWQEPNGAPSIGFHLRHLNGSCDRLLTYAKGENLSEAQFAFLVYEQMGAKNESAAELVASANLRINEIIAYLHIVPEQDFLAERFVGRARLKTNVIGLLFHLAEHTQRHVGSLIAIARVVAVLSKLK